MSEYLFSPSGLSWPGKTKPRPRPLAPLMHPHSCRRQCKIDFLQLPWAQKVWRFLMMTPITNVIAADKIKGFLPKQDSVPWSELGRAGVFSTLCF